MSHKRIAVLILAAGFSTRMTTGFKPLLPITFPYGECTALAALVRLYRSMDIYPLVVINTQHDNVHSTQALVAEAERLEIAHIVNAQPERGMFSSVCVGLSALTSAAFLGDTCEYCFVHPVDIPLVRPCTIHALLAARTQHTQHVLLPTYMEEEGHPPLIPLAHFSAICAWHGEQGLRGALQNLSVCHVPTADANVLLDMDTPDDYALVCARAPRWHVLEPEEALELLHCCHVPERGIAHAMAVGRVAACFAQACHTSGYMSVDVALAHSGGLLHDICKGQAQHEYQGGQYLRSLGFTTLAPLVEEHRDCILDATAPITEKELVYLADKYVCGSRIVPITERFAQKLTQYGHDAAAYAAIIGRRDRALYVEQRLAQLVSPQQKDNLLHLL